MSTEYPELPSDFSSYSMRQLVEWYNNNCLSRDKVKAFRTVSIGKQRCEKLVQQIEDQRQFERDTENMSDEELTAYAFGNLQPSPEEVQRREERQKRLDAVLPKSGAGSKKSLGITESWKDDETHQRRTTRNRVVVDYDGKSEEFRSVREAFELLGLPMEPHVRFRGKLKREGTKLFVHDEQNFWFRVVYKNDKEK